MLGVVKIKLYKDKGNYFKNKLKCQEFFILLMIVNS